MAHSLNNAAKARFMERASEFSTHGSRRGFVDMDLGLTKSQLNDAESSRESVVMEKRRIDRRLSELREDLGIPKGLSISAWISKRKLKYLPDTDPDESLVSEAHALSLRSRELQERLEELNAQRKKLGVYEQFERGGLTEADLYQRIAKQVLPTKVHNQILEAVDRAVFALGKK